MASSEGDDDRTAEALALASSALDAIPQASVMVFDTQLRYVLARGSALAPHGFSTARLEGRLVADALAPERWEFYAPLYRAALDGETCAVRVGSPDGERRYLVEVGPLRDADGTVAGGVSFALDITGRTEVEALAAQLAASTRAEARFHDLLEFAPDATVIVDESGRVVLANARADGLLGYSREELVGMPVDALLPERFRQGHAHHRAGFFADPRARPMGASLQLHAQHRDGREIPVEISLSPLHGAEGTVVSAAIRDVTARREAEAALQGAEERFRRAFEEAPIGMAMLDLDRRVVEVNEALMEITGYTREQLEGITLDAITHPDDLVGEQRQLEATLAGSPASHRAELRVLPARGTPLWVTLQTSVVLDADETPVCFLAQIQDVTDRRRYEARLRHLADHDPLTGLLNRRSFEHELAAHHARNVRYGNGGAAIVLDLDHFKVVNDTLGHRAGDDVITRAADALASRVRETDVLARLGGDEFAVLLPHADAAEARLVTENLLAAIRQETVELGGRARPLTASAGIALFEPTGELGGEDVLVNADLAMYDAKHAGRDRAEQYAADEHVPSRLKGRTSWAQRIGRALEHDGFELLAQPIVDLDTGSCSQYELLVRLRDERDGLVPPSAFLYVAERLGMVRDIDRWVTGRAIGLLATAQARDLDLTLEVNLSGLSIGDAGLLDLVARELERTRVPAERLIFEVTETAAVVNMTRASQFARDLTRLGCRFALDDFGAGYGSFYYLKHLPFDYLKIDGEFVKGCRSSETDRLLIKAAVDIARGMGKQTVAEFVGDDATVRLLTRLGVDFGQGFHLGRPAALGAMFERAGARAAERPPQP